MSKEITKEYLVKFKEEVRKEVVDTIRKEMRSEFQAYNPISEPVLISRTQLSKVFVGLGEWTIKSLIDRGLLTALLVSPEKSTHTSKFYFSYEEVKNLPNKLGKLIVNK